MSLVNKYAEMKIDKLNSKLLALVEYIRGEEDINPLQNWFEWER